MREQALFIDGSVDTKSKTGIGAYLFLDEISQVQVDQNEIRLKRFEDTSSTKLELQTLLWAVEETGPKNCSFTVYTDSQNIVSLPGRQARLQESEFQNRSGRPIRNRDLYQEFYSMLDSHNCRFEKVEGHQAQSKKGQIETIFTLVDRAARAELRRILKPQ